MVLPARHVGRAGETNARSREPKSSPCLDAMPSSRRHIDLFRCSHTDGSRRVSKAHPDRKTGTQEDQSTGRPEDRKTRIRSEHVRAFGLDHVRMSRVSCSRDHALRYLVEWQVPGASFSKVDHVCLFDAFFCAVLDSAGLADNPEAVPLTRENRPAWNATTQCQNHGTTTDTIKP